MKFKFWPILILLSGVAYAGDSVMEVIPLQNRPAAELQPLLAPLLEGDDRVIDDGSSLIIKAAPARMEAIKKLIAQLDGKLNNLVVSVLQSNSKTAAELNAEAAIAASPSGIAMHGMVADTRELSGNQTTQSVRTLEGQAAYIKTGQVRPMTNTNVYGSGYGYPMVGSNTQMVEASTGFAVTPRLSGEQVTIDIEPWSDRFQQGGRIATQGAHTTLRANLGEWVEIAGNVNDDQSRSEGFNTFNHSTAKNDLRILIKVDKAD